MAKQANRMMIGGFVVLAVIIMAASLVVFGSGKFFQKTNKYVLYFNESVTGLNVGAPVLFQGVPVGSVTSITLEADLVKLEDTNPRHHRNRAGPLEGAKPEKEIPGKLRRSSSKWVCGPSWLCRVLLPGS